MEVWRNKNMQDFIQVLNLTQRQATEGIFVLHLNEISEEVATAMSLYRNEFYEINIIQNQYNFKFRVDEQTFHPQGQSYVFFVAPNQVQSYEVLGPDPKANGFIIYINKEVLSGLQLQKSLPYFKRNATKYFEPPAPQFKALFNLVQSMHAESAQGGTHATQILAAYLKVFLLKSLSFFKVAGAQSTKHPQQVLTRFEALIQQEYIQHKSVPFYAQALAISARQLSNLTQLTVGKTPLQVIHDVMLNEAKALLAQSNNTVTQVAYAMGFEEPAHFSRFFKKHTALSPSAYQQHYQN